MGITLLGFSRGRGKGLFLLVEGLRELEDVGFDEELLVGEASDFAEEGLEIDVVPVQELVQREEHVVDGVRIRDFLEELRRERVARRHRRGGRVFVVVDPFLELRRLGARLVGDAANRRTFRHASVVDVLARALESRLRREFDVDGAALRLEEVRESRLQLGRQLRPGGGLRWWGGLSSCCSRRGVRRFGEGRVRRRRLLRADRRRVVRRRRSRGGGLRRGFDEERRFRGENRRGDGAELDQRRGASRPRRQVVAAHEARRLVDVRVVSANEHVRRRRDHQNGPHRRIRREQVEVDGDVIHRAVVPDAERARKATRDLLREARGGRNAANFAANID
mmetsp:Transcript_8096/g.33369  ORF Transcript_8096/g.33369 Transcript_8096/m.33369 type:complete len:336 (+) Transcript_8096:48-1055(+)